jgi:hypothetical protein
LLYKRVQLRWCKLLLLLLLLCQLGLQDQQLTGVPWVAAASSQSICHRAENYNVNCSVGHVPAAAAGLVVHQLALAGAGTGVVGGVGAATCDVCVVACHVVQAPQC